MPKRVGQKRKEGEVAMPLKKGKKNVGANIRELHKGETYARTKREHGKKKANEQSIAIALKQSRKRKTRRKGGGR